MITSWDAAELLDPMFKKWEDRTYDKWDVYPQAFNLLDDEKVRLIDIMDAAHKIGIAPGVVLMRRSHWLAGAL
jgi:hypothetical protein